MNNDHNIQLIVRRTKEIIDILLIYFYNVSLI